jgi:hypothetical protein
MKKERDGPHRRKPVVASPPGAIGAIMGDCPLTRCRDPDAPQETWQVYYGDVRVGSIAVRSGNPTDTDSWGWRCGFYPGSHPRDCTSGTAATFGQARAEFGRS